jgi:alpha-ketoglutarate-dependent taurine dioxygenase
MTPDYALVTIADQKQDLPLVVEPQAGRLDTSLDALISWHGGNRDFLEEKLLRHGAILFRGFDVRSPSAFMKFVRSVSDNLLDYVDGNSPRTKLTAGVYTSTEYPPEFFISLHNELSYSRHHPSRVFFGCIIAPRAGGETPIADSRAILKSMPGEIVEAFATKQVKYIRNLHSGRGYGLSWQDTFETTDRAAVEKFCEETSIDYEWKPHGGLKLIQIGPGIITHPRTCEEVWFNQADQFHPSNNPKQVYEAMKVMRGEGEDVLPQNAQFGDGTPIGLSMLSRIRQVVREHTVCFPWREGDVLAVDNLLVCHGRMPYSGPRRILVSMF